MSRNVSLIPPLKLFGAMQAQLNQNKGSMVFSNTGNIVNKTGDFPINELTFETPEPEKEVGSPIIPIKFK